MLAIFFTVKSPALCPQSRWTRLFALVLTAIVFVAAGGTAAKARAFTSTITEMDQIPRLRPEFQVPAEPNQIFYIQRSVNANTVVYAANLAPDGTIKSDAPVDAFWRWYNVDGAKKGLNFIERGMAYGVKTQRPRANEPITFTIAALPERVITLSLDAQKRPEALMQIGGRTVRLDYVYLHVVEGGLLPSIPELQIFGTDKATGKAIHEHLVQN